MKIPIFQTDGPKGQMTLRRFSRGSGRCGFTLIEMSVVVVIIGLVSALVFVRIGAVIPKERLRAAAADVAGAVRFARAAARLRRSEVSLQYDLDKGAWKVSVMPNRWNVTEPDKVPEPEVVYAGAPPKGIRISALYYAESGLALSGTATASFRPQGAVGEHMVILENESGDTIRVYVPALSGVPFVVEDGSSYVETRNQRRLQ